MLSVQKNIEVILLLLHHHHHRLMERISSYFPIIQIRPSKACPEEQLRIPLGPLAPDTLPLGLK